MRRLLLIAVTTAATVAIGGTALAASGPGRGDDHPSRVVVDDRPSHDVGDDHGTHSPSASVSASIDDRPSHDVGDDHGTHSPGPSASASIDDHGGLRDGHGRDDRAGDDHGGSRHRH
ncbi:hypothetical protein [Dactylosporangium darangshiense]|uniref:Uncharacterized protein n=1 Tax=Dactylosporangium darangshiense TaxID=579108 RepID=A0ABP8DL50_9ACTN